MSCCILSSLFLFFFFFFNATATTEIYTLSLHDALPICRCFGHSRAISGAQRSGHGDRNAERRRSEEHTSELQSHHDLVCRLLLEKKKNNVNNKRFNEHFAHYRTTEDEQSMRYPPRKALL